jgi:two-component system response regulator PilR (NtrC family)
MNTESQKVLVIDDEPDILELLNLTLSRMGLDVTTSATPAAPCRKTTSASA